jgi:SAM-dependent methyltransferase
LAFLRHTPLHPQWLVFRGEVRDLHKIAKQLRGTILDIGCGDRRISRILPEGAQYIGLDFYETSVNWYASRPDVYGDAHKLPLASGSLDNILLLDVLEHLPRPDDCLREIARTLKVGGMALVQTPFLYPVHDAPRDFQRLTLHGLRELARRFEFIVVEEEVRGTALDTAALLANLAFSKVVLLWLRRRNPLALLIAVLPLFVLVANTTAWCLSRFVSDDDFMPHGLKLTLKKR